MDGTIRTANQNFLDALGYALPKSRASTTACSSSRTSATRTPTGNSGKASTAASTRRREYKRIAKGGREIWIQASYNPILDLNGKPFKVVKYATDITAQAVGRKKAENARGLIESVAAGSEEMSASIREISETMTKSKRDRRDGDGPGRRRRPAGA